jgi:hypothetical protein
MKNKNLFIAMTVASVLGVNANSYAEDLNAIFANVNKYVADQNYSKALEELKWASKEIEKMNSKKIETFFPDTLSGFAGEKVTSSGALGMTNIERNYKNGNNSVKVALTNLGAAGGALGGLAQLGSMAALMGGQTGMESFRINGRTAQLDTTSGEPKLTVFMDSGSMLTLESSGTVDSETLKKMVEELKLDEFDKYLKGSK